MIGRRYDLCRSFTNFAKLRSQDKILAIQFLANEIAREEEIFSEKIKKNEVYELRESFEVAEQLRKLIAENERANAET